MEVASRQERRLSIQNSSPPASQEDILLLYLNQLPCLTQTALTPLNLNEARLLVEGREGGGEDLVAHGMRSNKDTHWKKYFDVAKENSYVD